MAYMRNTRVTDRRNRPFALRECFLALTTLACLACGGQPQHLENPDPNAGPLAQAGAPVAQDWKTPDNRDVRLVDHRGKVVFVVYFTTWCTPCVQVLDDLHRLRVSEVPEGTLEVVAVSLDLNPEKVLPSFTDALRLAYPIVLPDQGALRGRTVFGKVPAVPTLFVLDTKGRHIETLVGAIPVDYLKRRIQAIGENE